MIKTYPISRVYLFKRILARLLVIANKFPIMSDLLRAINRNLGDVEGIFHYLNVEREIENILFINEEIVPSGITRYYDIGGNYGQFAGQISLNNSSKHIFEPNATLREYILSYSPGANVYTKAVVPEAGNYSYVVDTNNSGANHVVPANSNSNLIESIDVESLIEAHGLKLEELFFVKIDVEGIEPELIEAFHKHLKYKGNAIYAFECLSKKHYQDVKAILQDYCLKEVRFSYQGSSDRNWGSIWTVLKVFIVGKDKLIVRDITEKIDRNFYSLIYCFPNA